MSFLCTRDSFRSPFFFGYNRYLFWECEPIILYYSSRPFWKFKERTNLNHCSKDLGHSKTFNSQSENSFGHVHLLVPYAKKIFHMIHVNLLIGKYQVLIILLLSLTQLLLVHSLLVSYAKKKFLYDTCWFACWQVSIAYCSLIV